MKADSWVSLEQTMASCHNLVRQSRVYRKRNRSDLSHFVGSLEFGVIWLVVLCQE